MRIEVLKRIFSAAFVAFGIWACAGTAKDESDYLEPAACGEKHFLWQAQKPGREAIWLLGSIHLADSSFYPLPAVVDSAFEASTLLAAELDLNEKETALKIQNLMLSKGTLPEGQTLKSVLPDSLFNRLDSAASAFGVPVQMLERFRPWMAALSLSAVVISRSGLSGEYGIDMELLARADDLGMKIFPIETPEEQVDIFADETDSLGVEYLARTLDEMASADTLVPGMAKAWKCGDIEAFRNLLGSESAEDVYGDKMYADRNLKMAKSADSLSAAGERVFIVVGAAHLIGRDNVLGKLSDLGYNVVRR